MPTNDRLQKEPYMKNWVKRKIRHGRVKVEGRWFYPDNRFMKYDGRLDGMTYLFGIYRGYTIPMLALVETEEGCNATTEEEHKKAWDTRPDHVKGTIPWYFWKEEHNWDDSQ